MTRNLFPRTKELGWLVYSLGGSIVLAVLSCLGIAMWYHEAKARFESEAAKIVGRGEPLWFEDLRPPAVPLADDAAPLALQAISKLVLPSDGFDELVRAEPPRPPGIYEPIETTLAANRPALDMLAQALGKPYCRFEYDYTERQTFGILLDHVQKSRDMSRLLHGDVLHSLAKGDQDRAVAAIKENLDLSELLREEPFVVAQLVRIAIAASAIRSLEPTLAHARLAGDQFAAVDDRLNRMSDSFQLRRTVVADRASVLTAWQHMDQNASLIMNDSVSGANFAARFDSKKWYLRPALWREQAHMLHAMSEFADLVDKTGPEAVQQVADLESRWERVAAELPLNREGMGYMPPVTLHLAGLRHRQRLIIARLAIRVARYRSEHGELPASLKAVIDEPLLPMLDDLFSGKPLVYRATGSGFVIYPVGEDGIDQGGGMKPDETEGRCRFEVCFPE